MPEESQSASRPRTRAVLSTLLASTAMFGAVTASSPGAVARTSPLHCKQSPQGQDCTNGGDSGGGGWSPPTYYELVASLGDSDEYQRSDGQDATNMDVSEVLSATGRTHCELEYPVASSIRGIICY